MKLSLLFAAGFLLAIGSAFASSVPICATNTLAAYEALSQGCSVGDLIFDNFSYNDSTILSTSPTVVTASEVTVTPVTGTSDVGLTFSGAFSAGSLTIQDQSLTFDVQTTSGAATITDLGLSMDSSVTGAGTVAISENINNLQYHLETTDSLLGPDLSDSDSVDPALSSISAYKDILLTGAVGTASLSSFTETFSETPAAATPEPGYLGLLALGFPVLLFFKNRRRRQ